MKKLQNITLVTFGGVDKAILNQIAKAVQTELDLNVHVLEKYFDITVFYDPTRRQYNANHLLHLLKTNIEIPENIIVGVFKVDLFIPILTYIFGQAMLNGNYAVASYYRLQNERYGLEKNSELMLLRLKKEVIHELGHTFGLIHCHNAGCVMLSSTYVEDIDQKNALFCKACKAKLNE